MPFTRTLYPALLVVFGLCLPTLAAAQVPEADPADVGTIAGIMHAWYDVINGPPGAPRQWRRDSTLYTAQATFVSMDQQDGKPAATIYTPEQYRRAVNAGFVEKGFYETEVGSRVERFGNVAQVRSVYETRRTAEGPVTARGVNYILLYWDGTRWWITVAVWEDEHDSVRLPGNWVGAHEAAP
jgi:hypothetical protein